MYLMCLVLQIETAQKKGDSVKLHSLNKEMDLVCLNSHKKINLKDYNNAEIHV